MALGLFDVPLPRPTRPGLFREMAELRAAPDIARSQSRAQAYERLGQLPQTLFNAAQQFQQYRGAQQQYKSAQQDALPTKTVAPALALRFPEIADIPFGKAKDFLSSLRIETQAQEVPAITEEEALKRGMVKEGTRIIKPPRSARLAENLPQVLNRLAMSFNADPNVRKNIRITDTGKQINSLLSSNNPIADASIPTVMARHFGEVGALSEADKAPFGGSIAFDARFNQAMSNFARGKITKENRGFLRQLASTMEKNARGNLRTAARIRAKQFSKIYKGKISEEEIFSILDPSIETSLDLKDLTTQDLSTLTDEELQNLEGQ